MATKKQSAPLVRNKFSPRIPVIIKCGRNKAKQSFKDECDINNIMAQYQKSGLLTHLSKHGEEYGAITGESFHDSMTVVAKANTMFEELPSSIRRQFNNEPAAFLEFVQNPENHDQMVKMGLAHPQKQPTQAEQTARTAQKTNSEGDTPTESKEAPTEQITASEQKD